MFKSKKTNFESINHLIICMLVLFLVATIAAVGDDGQQGIVLGADDSPDVTQIDEGRKEVNVPEGTTLSWIGFGENQNIKKGLQILGTRFQKNIVPSSKVDGPLMVTGLYDVTFKQALDAILGHDFKYEQDGNLLRIYTADEYQKIKQDEARMVNRVFTLYYISAEEAAKLIKPILSQKAQIQSSTAAEKGVTSGESITSESTGGDAVASHDTIVIRDFPENIAEADEILRKLDIRPKQVLIEATILTATLNDSMELGVNLNMLGGVALDGSSTSSQIGTTDSLSTTTTTPIGQIGAGIATGTPIEVAGFATAGGSGLRVGITSGDVALFISALESVTDTTVLANPKILAVNKQLGQVYIGRKIGYKSQTTQTQTSTTQSVKFLDTGTKLSFRPYIGDDGYIRMDIHPKDSSGSLNEDKIPNEDSTELATNVMVKDGQTIVIGGLFRDVVTTTRRQIPLLGDLPLIGGLFRGSTDATQRQEVIILLTCHIIEEPSDLEGQARAEDISRKRIGAENALHWADREKWANEHYAKAAQSYLEGYNTTALEELDEALRLRPTYLEALRLKEKILRETDPDKAAKINRKILQQVDENADMWLRR